MEERMEILCPGYVHHVLVENRRRYAEAGVSVSAAYREALARAAGLVETGIYRSVAVIYLWVPGREVDTWDIRVVTDDELAGFPPAGHAYKLVDVFEVLP